MLLNRLQSPEDFHKFRSLPPEKLADILKNADPHVIKLMQDVMYSLMMKMNIPTSEASEYVKALGGKQMGYLFENMQKMDIQAERRNTAEARRQAEEAIKRADEAECRANEAEDRANEAEDRANEAEHRLAEAQKNAVSHKQESEYKAYIAACRDLNCSREETVIRLAERFQTALADDPAKAREAASQKADLYWDAEE